MRKWLTNHLFFKENYYRKWNRDEDEIMFDCSTCGDPTAGSYIGPLASNMCWECTLKFVDTHTNLNRR
jgi:hypothetical protein